MSKSDRVRVSVEPFVVISAVLAAVLWGASVWNGARTYNKLDKLRAHVQAIYVAHQEEITTVVQTGNWKNLEGINAAEKEARSVYVVRRNEGGRWEILCDGREYLRVYEKMCTQLDLNPDLVEKIWAAADTEKTVSVRGEVVKNLIFGERNLFAFVPIKEKNQFLGWMVVKMGQTKEF